MKKGTAGKMSIRTGLKKVTGVLLIAAMACPPSLTALADIPDSKTTVMVEGTRLEGEDIPEDKNIVYFGASELTVTEADRTYTLPVYRTGSAEFIGKGSSFTIHSQDISALYDKDYRLLGEGRSETPHEKTILELLYGDNGKATEKTVTAEKASGSDAIIVTDITSQEDDSNAEDQEEGDTAVLAASSSDAVMEEDIINEDDITEGDISVEEVSEDNVRKDSSTEDAGQEELSGEESYEKTGTLPGSSFSVQETAVSSLAELKQKQTGEATREEGSSDLAANLTEAVLAQLLPDIMSEILYSCEQTVEFAPGETETLVTFCILNDELAEGTETFNLMIVDAEDAEP